LLSTYFDATLGFGFALPFIYFFFTGTVYLFLLKALLLQETDRSADELEFRRFLTTFACPSWYSSFVFLFIFGSFFSTFAVSLAIILTFELSFD